MPSEPKRRIHPDRSFEVPNSRTIQISDYASNTHEEEHIDGICIRSECIGAAIFRIDLIRRRG
jgi:hypothetical protein